MCETAVSGRDTTSYSTNSGIDAADALLMETVDWFNQNRVLASPLLLSQFLGKLRVHTPADLMERLDNLHEKGLVEKRVIQSRTIDYATINTAYFLRKNEGLYAPSYNDLTLEADAKNDLKHAGLPDGMIDRLAVKKQREFGGYTGSIREYFRTEGRRVRGVARAAGHQEHPAETANRYVPAPTQQSMAGYGLTKKKFLKRRDALKAASTSKRKEPRELRPNFVYSAVKSLFERGRTADPTTISGMLVGTGLSRGINEVENCLRTLVSDGQVRRWGKSYYPSGEGLRNIK